MVYIPAGMVDNGFTPLSRSYHSPTSFKIWLQFDIRWSTNMLML